ncbi:MAG TPA: PAS domain-containing protein, partial [Candidatus Saccharimonadales bacterium]|nr:PAS domain-containing protein [Candidatus Saccharimonadales bacterium]
MTLQSRIALYLVAIHLLLGAVAFYALLDRPWLLIGAEVVFAASALTGYALAKSFFVPLDLIRTGSELIRERDFSSHFAEVGQAEMDHLIRIYNTMIDQLREERRQVEERNLFLDKILEASPSGVVTLGHDGTIRQINPAAARLVEAGLEGAEHGTPGSMIGRHLDVFPPAVAASLRDLADGGSAVVAWRGGRRLRIRRGSFYDRGADLPF